MICWIHGYSTTFREVQTQSWTLNSIFKKNVYADSRMVKDNPYGINYKEQGEKARKEYSALWAWLSAENWVNCSFQKLKRLDSIMQGTRKRVMD